MNRGVLAPVLAVALFAMLVAGPVGLAASGIVLEPTVQSFEVSLNVPVYNETVSIAANSTHTITVSLPANWTTDDIQAVHVIARGVTGEISLAAKDANGSVLATGTIVPLSTEYHQTLPPTTKTIELSAGAAANATIIVLVQSKPIKVTVQLYESKISLEPGTAGWVHGKMTVVDGPAGIYIWTQTTATDPLLAKTYRGIFNPGDIPDPNKEWDGMAFYYQPGDTQEFSVLIDASHVTQDKQGEYRVTVNFYASPEFDGDSASPGENAQLVATVQLSGSLGELVSDLGGDNIDAKSFGVGVAVALILGIAFLSTRKKR